MIPVEGNRISLLKNGGEFFPALETDIDAATADIRVEAYIFVEDVSGLRIANALMRAAGRGVNVRVMIDGFGSRTTPSEFFDRMRNAGVVVYIYLPVHTVFDFRRYRVRRLHRKIVLIDGKTAYVGGINIIDDFNENLSAHLPRYDYAVRLEGPILADIYSSVQQLWQKKHWFNLAPPVGRTRPPPVSPLPVGSSALVFIARDNFRSRRSIERAYIAAIDHAKNEVLVVSSYFFPGRKLRNALVNASRRGVMVTVLLQGAADHPIMQMATRALYDKFLGAGITIYEYQPAMLHGKVAVIDGRWATVGSSNLDPFSLLVNLEANVVAIDTEFAETLRASVMAEIKTNAIQLNFARWQQRGPWSRLKSWVALKLARLVTAIIGVKYD